jgi:hypothetical protein
MDRRDADGLLTEDEVAVCMEGGLREMRELEESLLASGIPATVGMEKAPS